MFKEDEIKAILEVSYKDMDEEIDFESFLRVSFWSTRFSCFLLIYSHTYNGIDHWRMNYALFFNSFHASLSLSLWIELSKLWKFINWQAHINLQSRATAKSPGSKNSSSFLKATTTTVHHSINESEKASYVAHINSYLAEDPFLKKYLPLDPSTNALFDLAKDGVLLW